MDIPYVLGAAAGLSAAGVALLIGLNFYKKKSQRSAEGDSLSEVPEERVREQIKEVREEFQRVLEDKNLDKRKIKELQNKASELADQLQAIAIEKQSLEKQLQNVTDEKQKLEKQLQSVTSMKQSLEKQLQGIMGLLRDVFSGKKPSVSKEIMEIKKIVGKIVEKLEDEGIPFLLNDRLYERPEEEKEYQEAVRKRLELLKSFIGREWLFKGRIVCFAGRYSAGKSSIINSLLGERELLPTDVTPETAIPTYIVPMAGDNPYVINVKDEPREISRESMKFLSRRGSAELLQQDDRIFHISSIVKSLVIPEKKFKNIIIDTPGIDPSSMSETDRELTIESIRLSDVIFWVIDVNDGQIGKGALELLKEVMLERRDTKLYVILNKADTKPPTKLKNIGETVKSALKRSGIKVSGVYPFTAKRERRRGVLEQSYQEILKVLEISEQKDKASVKSKLLSIVDDILSILERFEDLGNRVAELIKKYNGLDSEREKLEAEKRDLLETIKNYASKVENHTDKVRGLIKEGGIIFKHKEITNPDLFSDYLSAIKRIANTLASETKGLEEKSKEIGKKEKEIEEIRKKLSEMEELREQFEELYESLKREKLKLQEHLSLF